MARSIDGDVVGRHDRNFDEVSHLFNPRFDRVQPLAVVEATSASDVREAVRFARRFNLRARPKAGGHSYVGASTVSNGLVIDVGRLHGVHVDVGNASVSLGAGAQLYHAHALLARHGRTLPTGTCPTVGAAGLTLGGGLGVASRQFGLTCDQLSGLTMVTADGRIQPVDAHHNRDLFWACRGGGGGNFGVLTAMRFYTQVARRIGFFLLSFPWSKAPVVIRGWAKRLHTMKRSAWANLHLEASADGSTQIRIVGVCRAGDEGAEAAAMEVAAGISATSVSTFEKSFMDGVSFLGGGSTSARQVFAAGSDVIEAMSRDLSRTLPKIVAHRAASGHAAAAILDPLTGAVRDRAPGATAFPWRRHLCDIQWYVALPRDAHHQAVQAAYQWVGSAHHAIRPHSVGGYVNYLEPGRSVASYYGRNYARLKQVKREVDPTGFFSSPYTLR